MSEGRFQRPLSKLAVLPPCYISPRAALDGRLSWLPAENFGTVAAGICTFWVGLRGLTPCARRALWVVNLPKPVKATSSPPLQRVGDRVEERVDGFRRVALREACLVGDLVDELLFCHVHPPSHVAG